MDRTAPLRIVYVFDNGSTSDLALGTIDADGVISVDKIAKGQEPRVSALLEDLNASPKIIVMGGSMDPDAEPGALSEREVYRGEPGFLDALTEQARRFYRVDLQFSRAALEGGLAMPDFAAKLMIDPEVEANLAVNLTPPRGPGVFDD